MALRARKLREMSPDELAKEERELRDQIWKLQLQRSTGQLSDPNKVAERRRDLARVLTVMREMEPGPARRGGRR